MKKLLIPSSLVHLLLGSTTLSTNILSNTNISIAATTESFSVNSINDISFVPSGEETINSESQAVVTEPEMSVDYTERAFQLLALAELTGKNKNATVKFDIYVDKDPEKVDKILVSDDTGSGFIIKKEPGTNSTYKYTVLAADHTFLDKHEEKKYIFSPDHSKKDRNHVRLTTSDGKKQPVEPQNITRLRQQSNIGLDLAIVTFESDINYPIVTIAEPIQSGQEDLMAVYGFPRRSDDTGEIGDKVKPRYNQGIITNYDPTYNDYEGIDNEGYHLIYNSLDDEIINDDEKSITKGGMSGGPVFDENNRVIGIHGDGEGLPLVNSSTLTDNNTPKFEDLSCKRQSINRQGAKAGIPINLFLDQLNPTALSASPEISSLNLDRNSLDTNNDELQSDPKSSRSLYAAGFRLFCDTKYDEAISKYDEAISKIEAAKTASSEEYSEYLLAKAYIARGDAHYSRAKSLAQKANPSNIKITSTEADIVLKHYQKAIEDYQKAKDINEKSTRENKCNDTYIEAFIHRAEVYFNQGEQKAGIDEYNEMVKTCKDPILKIRRGLAKRVHGGGTPSQLPQEWQNPIQYLENPEDKEEEAELLVSLGIAKYGHSPTETESAREDWDKAIQEDPSDLRIYRSIYAYLKRRGDTDEALKYLEKAIDNNPGDEQVVRWVDRTSGKTPLQPSSQTLPQINLPSLPQPNLPTSIETYTCEDSRLTVRTKDGTRQELIEWSSQTFTSADYPPTKRCEMVSGRLNNYFGIQNASDLQEFRDRLDRMTHGSMGENNNIPALCIATTEENANKNNCEGGDLIITLEPNEEEKEVAEAVLQELKQALQNQLNENELPLQK